ncbi:DUF445 domain-containing protein [Candidatus Enterovibrio escicola]|uniref:DUF445 domain-containing protein n=1 Tax=Candidatus Enterovibrio escicola TaxID=1927127 RepID=A0A2A5T7L4_9GAMM|nr:DUF445 domain-containing protein [Candidatus Enterovibrio escacola]PCS24151.1 hypothetical protein BTN49_0145 [Candidatus Enterovibrio escacola]
MNKSFLTHVIAIVIFAAGYYLDEAVALYGGLFALSGSLTNLLAIHMLFERVPFLYGSGVIQVRFEAFKLGIKSLIMDQFFTKENIDRFFSKKISESSTFNFALIIEHIDFNSTFDGLIDVINNSSFGSMLMLMGGPEALIPLRDPFVTKMRESIIGIIQQKDFLDAVKNQVQQLDTMNNVTSNVESIIEQRFTELTPELVKNIIQTMIREHLSWLVVWGGVFGAMIGVISALVTS